MSSRPPRKPLDMQAIKRVMSNQLFETIGANRIRSSVAPSNQIDPQKAEILGKTLGELQDFRDLAHDESLKTEQVARDVATEKKSIRDRIAEMKAKIEHKKYLLDKTRAKNKTQGRYQEEVSQLEGRSANTGKQAYRILKEDTEKQLNEVYKLRDKLLTAGQGRTTIPPQVKMRIEERMAELESKVDRDFESDARRAGNVGAALGAGNFTIDETKYTLNEIKKESEEIDKDIEREIDNKNSDINDSKNQLMQVLREKQDLKYRIGTLESEVNKLEFQKNKIDLESQVRGLKDNKTDYLDKLDSRIQDAKYNEDHIRDLINHATDIRIDIGYIERIDVESDRRDRIRTLQEDLRFKKKNEQQLKDEIRELNGKLSSLGEVHIDTSMYHHEENYSHLIKDLNIGYTDIIQSVKDHLTANSAILRKEKEIKEMEARIALIDLEALEEEYQRLRILYDRDSEILRDLEERYSLIHDRLIRLRARLREINDLIRSLEERLETARFEIEDAERKYRLIKVPKKVEYVVNERVEDVLIKKKWMEKGERITERQFESEKRGRASTHARGQNYYRPTPEELDSIIPQGSKVRITQNEDERYYNYGTLKFYFIKAADGEFYVNHDGTTMSFDDFITLYEAQERGKSGRMNAQYVEHGNIDEEEYGADVGEEMGGSSIQKTAYQRSARY